MQTICSYFRHHIIRHTLQLCNNGRRSHNYRGQLFDRLFGTLRMLCGRHIFHSLKTRPDFDEFMIFFKIPKIQKLYNIRAIFLRVVWTSKRSKWSLKSQKTRFFKAFLRGWKKNIARTLYNFCIFGILKQTPKFVKIGKTSGNTLVFWSP